MESSPDPSSSHLGSPTSLPSTPPTHDASDQMDLEGASTSPILPPHQNSSYQAPLFSFSSSDPLAPLPLSPTNVPRPSQIRKRGPSSPLIDNRHSQNNTSQNNNQAAKRAILKARDLLVEAYTLTTSKDEQAKLLDLLEVFREYTEHGKLQKASNIISSQIANLETTTRQIESKARALSKVPTPTQTHTQTHAQTQPIKPKQPTYATIASTSTK